MSSSSLNKEKNTIKKKKNILLRILLYLTILLFILLLFSFWATFFYVPKQEEENIFDDKIYPFFHVELKDPLSEELDGMPTKTNNLDTGGKSNLSLEDRDEFAPTMDRFFNERELTKKNIDALFENMKSPKEISSFHSTFGKEVLYIYHTHSRESFLPYLEETDIPEEAYHSKANITLVGELLGRALERRGVGTTVNSTDIVQELATRGLNYNSSYNVSGEQVRAALKDNKDLEIFLDLHRDSLRSDSTTTVMNGVNYAKLLFVVGTGHEGYGKNLTFAEGLQTILDNQYPGLSKGVIQKSSKQGNGIYNQDISPNSIIVEIGGVDNTVEELHRTTEVFADVLSEYYFHEEM
ncbi:stage II sporulation protein P [Psychrobacillus sp. BL-248-WT-3]|uniref:stage II sporulation protein P n=1 Tax=Psychrobacillus sp. BL-248-WT-3 TaxID=2725306 RepID=UPI001F0DAE22|nr:stage II sporulation protein P [Psychrobacillus sp. BL-248-WT-3]